MDKARFESGSPRQTSERHWTERGLDQVEFFLSANLGEEPRPLARIVSGGELSRVMLALKTLAAATAGRPGRHRTLIFDEVDAGIGGRVATVVGEKLASLGRALPGAVHHPPAAGGRLRPHALPHPESRPAAGARSPAS